MWPIVIVWLVAILLGWLLWSRFTRAPNATTVLVPPSGESAKARRVYPVWLVLVMMLLLVLAIWMTLHFGADLATSV